MVKLQNRHPATGRDVDCANDHDVVALDGTLPNAPAVQLGVRRGEWLAALVGGRKRISICGLS
jgi:hypothetical protein